jgi:hypothetical protein
MVSPLVATKFFGLREKKWDFLPILVHGNSKGRAPRG